MDWKGTRLWYITNKPGVDIEYINCVVNILWGRYVENNLILHICKNGVKIVPQSIELGMDGILLPLLSPVWIIDGVEDVDTEKLENGVHQHIV